MIKKLAITIAVLSGFWATQAYASQTLHRQPNNLGLVGYWSMEDGVGTQATDFSGRGNTGTLTNGPTWVAGKRGRALNFDGNNDYVNIDSSLSSVPAYTESTPYTIAFWVKGAPNQVYNGVYSEGSSSTDTPYVVIRTQNGTNKMQIIIVNDAGGIRLNAATTNSVVFDNAWHHFAWVSNGATSKVYVDGVQDTGDFSSFSSSGGTYTLNERTIGTTRGLTSGTSFSGSIDDVRIYNRALGATEIANMYNDGQATIKAKDNTGLVGYWSMDDGVGSKATDFSGKGNTGTLTNFALTGSTSNWVTGKFGTGLNFDGVDDYVSISNLALGSTFSLSIWIKPDTLVNYDYPMWFYGAGSPDLEFGIGDSGGGINRFFYTNGSYFNATASNLTIGSWNHLAYVAVGGTLNLYINGILIEQVSYSPTSITSLRIGSDAVGDNFDGSIDDVRIYNRALSAQQVADLYNAGQVTIIP